MPESPDFEQIARAMLEASDGEPGETRIVEQLRLVWNARGAADLAALSPNLHVAEERAVRSLDR